MGRRLSIYQGIAAVACVAIVACASFYFASVSGRYATSEQPNINVLFWVSIAFYLSAMISSGSVLYISEREREDE
jgi:hypothetical protein